MRKLLTVCIVTLIPLVFLSGCLKKIPTAQSEPESAAQDPSSAPAQSEPAKPESSDEASTPTGAADKLLSDLSDLDDERIVALAQEYFAMQSIPEEYYSVIKPLSERVSYKIGNYKINGDNAAVDIAVTAVDAEAAFSRIVPAAVAHLAVMQMTGKDVSNPEKIIAEYIAKNTDWDALPKIKTNTTLHLVMGADGEWKADASNPDNLDFANAVSGGALNVALNLKEVVARYKQ